MAENVTFSIGSVALIDKADAQIQLFNTLFKNVGGKAHELKETAKLLVANRLDKAVSINRLTEVYPKEFFNALGFKDVPPQRNLYRNLERIGKNYGILLPRYQQLALKNGLVTPEQHTDFSSTYFEGKKSEWAELGYSRDSQPGKKQLVFGIATGINNIPTALTIQKGNVQDKTHFREMLDTVKKVMDANSLLIFDCGGNTRDNKSRIRALGFNYLTLKAKHKNSYREQLAAFKNAEKEKFEVNDVAYECVKLAGELETSYVFYSEKLESEQQYKKDAKFKCELEKNEPKLRKVGRGKDLESFPTTKGYVVTSGKLQRVFGEVPNPFLTGLEGYFILESSVDVEPERVLRLYKDRDKAEKLIRDMKEGTELRPIRHWSKWAVMGCLFVVFLTNCLTNLTLFFAQNSLVRNVKLLKKYLQNLTLTVVYPKNGLRIALLSNISSFSEAIFGGFLRRYGQTSFEVDW